MTRGRQPAPFTRGSGRPTRLGQSGSGLDEARRRGLINAGIFPRLLARFTASEKAAGGVTTTVGGGADRPAGVAGIPG